MNMNKPFKDIEVGEWFESFYRSDEGVITIQCIKIEDASPILKVGETLKHPMNSIALCTGRQFNTGEFEFVTLIQNPTKADSNLIKQQEDDNE